MNETDGGYPPKEKTLCSFIEIHDLKNNGTENCKSDQELQVCIELRPAADLVKSEAVFQELIPYLVSDRVCEIGEKIRKVL